MELLKSINPQEAGLLDAASRCHIRFRLGGHKFPPIIYYKIFSHGGIVDINAFAPRDFMAFKNRPRKRPSTFTLTSQKKTKTTKDGICAMKTTDGALSATKCLLKMTRSK